MSVVMSSADLIKLNPEQIREYTNSLANLAQRINNEVINLNAVNSTAKQYWNQGIGTDSASYGQQLEKNIKTINEKIVPNLNEYVKTMNTLIDAINDISKRTVG